MPPETDIKKKFGRRLRALREQQNLSQEELAFRAGLHRTYVSSVERGDRNVALVNIGKFAKALKVEICELFRGQLIGAANVDQDLISLQDASKISGLAASHLRLLARAGRLRAQKVGRDWFTTRQAVRDYLADSELRRRGRRKKPAS